MAEEEEEKPKEMIKLVSKEGHEFSVEKQAAMVSNTIKSMLTGPGMFTENESDTINFPEISKEVLEEVGSASPFSYSLILLVPLIPVLPLAFAFPLSEFRAARDSNGVAQWPERGWPAALLAAGSTLLEQRCLQLPSASCRSHR